MKPRRWRILFATAIFALTSSTLLANGQGRGSGKGHGKDKDDDDDRGRRIVYSSHDRQEMHGWYHEHEKGLPPGLAKRDRLPPGLEKQLRERGTLPPGLEKRIQPLPPDLERRLGRPLEGCRHAVIGGHIVLINVKTKYVYSVIHFEIP
jgi:hypothetical protein